MKCAKSFLRAEWFVGTRKPSGISWSPLAGSLRPETSRHDAVSHFRRFGTDFPPETTLENVVSSKAAISVSVVSHPFGVKRNGG
jgi:hypothetical protein